MRWVVGEMVRRDDPHPKQEHHLHATWVGRRPVVVAVVAVVVLANEVGQVVMEREVTVVKAQRAGKVKIVAKAAVVVMAGARVDQGIGQMMMMANIEVEGET